MILPPHIANRIIMMKKSICCLHCHKKIKFGEIAIKTITEGTMYRNYITDYYHEECYDKLTRNI